MIRPVSKLSCSTIASLAGVLCFQAPAIAQDTGLARCLAIADISDRVACYDAIAQAEQGSVAPVSALPQQTPTPAMPAVSPTGPDREQEFGLSQARIEANRPVQDRSPDDVQYTVVSAETVGAGYWQFVTEQGQVWRLMERVRSFRPPNRGDSFTVRKGRLGSFYMEADRQPSTRVVRIR